MQQGPLDMRMDLSQPLSAAEFVNHAEADEMAAIFRLYGEERFAGRIARAIVGSRPLVNTRQLADTIQKAIGYHQGHIHPATRTFQAIRIYLNEELNHLTQALPLAITNLNKGGRLAVISFHSLEDRIVKQTFQRESKDCICPPEQPVCTCNHHASVLILTRHPIEAGEQELSTNPRARSARLRVVEKI